MWCGPPGGVRRPARASADAPPDARLVCTAGARLVCTATHQHKYAPSPTLPPHPDTQHPGAHTRHTGTDAAHGPAPLHANNPQTSSPTRLSTHTHTRSHPHTHTPTHPHTHTTTAQPHKHTNYGVPLSLCVWFNQLSPHLFRSPCALTYLVLFSCLTRRITRFALTSPRRPADPRARPRATGGESGMSRQARASADGA